ncbi:TolC family protein [Paraherbaspirillum soli]|uniref:TolC family protein n=1 Tax=Paraherbaspirillum soli TaxID=631222 RepID=A0ABW0MC02_9BURK
MRKHPSTTHLMQPASLLPPLRNAMLAGSLALAIGGCAITTTPLTPAEQAAQVRTDRAAMFRDQEPVSKPITLSEAMARAIKYNLDHRLKLMEEAVAQRQLDLSSYDLLPRLTLAAGYTARSNFQAASSEDVFTHTQSLAPSTSSDRHLRTADLTFTWNILDFGVSYYQAQEQADRTLILKERRRKVLHSLMQQVRQAYWLALGAQELDGKVAPMLHQVESALADIRRIEQEKLRPPKETLYDQRQLLDTLRQLEAIRDELAQAKPHLAALMNLDPGQPFELANNGKMPVPELHAALPAMVETALLNRPELVEARYNERISVTETKKAMAKLMPGLEFSLGEHYDSNSFLVDKRWADAGLRVSWNIFNLLSAKKITQTAQAQVEVAKMQRMALNMAVLSQVYIAYRDYHGHNRQYELALNLDEVDHRILDQTKNETRSDAQGKLVQIRAELSALYSDLRLQQNYGALQNAYGAILATLGVDPLPDEVAGHDIETLAKAVEQADSRRLNIPDAAPASEKISQ